MKWSFLTVGFISHVGGSSLFLPPCVLVVFAAVSPKQPTWKPLPLFVHSSTEGKLISTV